MENVDATVVDDFGKEWKAFDQHALSTLERAELFNRYFSIFPWDRLDPSAKGFDLGCGSGRWAMAVAPRVGELHCIDPSASALEVARRNLRSQSNCRFHQADVGCIPLPDRSMDFGYSLGVLHHVPDTACGIAQCAKKLKPGAPFLVYIYYALDCRPMWYVFLWKVTDLARRVIATLPFRLKLTVCYAVAACVYFPLARLAAAVNRCGISTRVFPLSSYSDRSFYTMRTDALDRFGTKLEQRFTRKQIQTMMESAGLEDIRFRSEAPYWCAVGIKT